MKNKQKILFAIPIVVGLVLVIRELLKNKKTSAPIPQGGSDAPIDINVGNGSDTSSGGRNDRFPLKKGSRGLNVYNMQRALLACNPEALPRYGADSDFGSETEAGLFAVTGKNTINSMQELLQLQSDCGTWTFPMANPNANMGLPKLF